MSRAAAAQSAKKEQKAAIAEKNAEKERLAALGMTPALKKLIGTDVLLCTECGATQLGPTTCECKGGKRKPAPDFECVPQLIAAAKARQAEDKAADMKANANQQSQVAKDREKRREKQDADKNDLNAEFQGDGIEVLQIVEFPVGKLGMDIEANAVSKVSENPSNAAELGVKPGWVISQVNGTPVPAKKAAIIKEVAACMKQGPVKFGFRVPIVTGYHFCGNCDKFQAAESFNESQITDKGPGKQMCAGCEEFADMGF
eukprot:gb/GFBE01075193.1/.p1 GENE.gb/GFBE01075193.1/~~gb/GFBE01075193.1/.p1  ORF type:complete len:258 (+),score=73.76 gb/GFBE01075193.1/:1-774(+)